MGGKLEGASWYCYWVKTRRMASVFFFFFFLVPSVSGIAYILGFRKKVALYLCESGFRFFFDPVGIQS